MKLRNFFKKVPTGATHVYMPQEGSFRAGGRFVAQFYFFKQNEEREWLVFVTDNDNEYPRWSASDRGWIYSAVPNLVSLDGEI